MADKTQDTHTTPVGPSYRTHQQKPSATVSVDVKLDNVHVLSQTPQLIALLSYVHFPNWASQASELRIVQENS
jgi:uracil phosphoribosyltransferase